MGPVVEIGPVEGIGWVGTGIRVAGGGMIEVTVLTVVAVTTVVDRMIVAAVVATAVVITSAACVRSAYPVPCSRNLSHILNSADLSH